MSSLKYASTFDKDVKPIHVLYQVGNVEGKGLIVVMLSMEEGLATSVLVTLPEKLCLRRNGLSYARTKLYCA